MDAVNDDELFPEELRDALPLLGPYALGQLDDVDRARVDDALASSELARMLFRDLGEAAEALKEADPAHINDYDEPPEELEGRILAAARERRPTRRPRVAAFAAAAAGIVVLAVAGLVGLGGDDKPAVPREAITFETAPGVEVLEAALIAHTWGTEVEFVVDGVEDGETYTVAFLNENGDAISAGTFLGVDDRPVDCRMNAALLRDDAAGLVVSDPSGEIIFETDLT